MADPTKNASDPVVEPGKEATPASSSKFEFKDNSMLVDGKKVVYESDLIAAKKGLEKQIEEAQAVHNSAIDKAKLDLSEAQTRLAEANAKVTTLSQASQSGAVSAEDIAKLKKEAEEAKKAVGQDAGVVLDLRRKLVLATYPGQVTAEQLKDKTSEQLTAFEEALKAVLQSRGGPGAYAVGGAGGSSAGMTAIDRAKAVIAATPIRGTRTVETK